MSNTGVREQTDLYLATYRPDLKENTAEKTLTSQSPMTLAHRAVGGDKHSVEKVYWSGRS